MSTNDLSVRIDDAKTEGWKVAESNGETRAVLKKPDYGSLGPHVLIAILTVWWTLGIGNILYAAKRYWLNSDKRVIRVDGDDE